ncbi:MAG: helix-turn-helix transcriptional regulator [Flavobacteriaceae bacterium]
MVNSTDFAKRLQKILDYYGLSATAFSDQIDFNRSTISHLLSGRNKPSLEFIIKVLHEFPEVEWYWLIHGKGSFPAVTKSMEEISPSPPLENSKIKKELSFPLSQNSETKKRSTNIEIERIVIFFKDGSFQLYE